MFLMIRAILFDLGDTVFNPDWNSMNQAMINEVGIPIIMPPHIKKVYGEEVLIGKRAMEDVFRMILAEHDKTISIEKVVLAYKKNYDKYATLNDKMIDLIDKLQNKIKIYALSNTNKIHKEVNKQRRLFTHFEHVFLSCDMGIRKPDKRIYLLILDQLHVKPDEILFIDDNDENIQIAKSLSIKAIKYINYDSLISELKKLRLY